MARLIAAICAAFLTFGAGAHPYQGDPVNAPLVFIEHKTADGRVIFTNIPLKCFHDGRLTCLQLHPIFKGPGTIRKPDH